MELIWKCLIMLCIFLPLLFTCMDFVYREMKRRYIILASIPSLLLVLKANIANNIGISILLYVLPFLVIILSFALLDDDSLGAIDFISAPLFSFWFGYGYVIYILAFCLVQMVFLELGVKLFVTRFANNLGGINKGYPALFSHLISMGITYLIIGSPIVDKIFTTI